MRFAIVTLTSLLLILSPMPSTAQSPINPNHLSEEDQEYLSEYIQQCEVCKADKNDLQEALDNRKFMQQPSFFKTDEALIGGAILIFVSGYALHGLLNKN